MVLFQSFHQTTLSARIDVKLSFTLSLYTNILIHLQLFSYMKDFIIGEVMIMM